MNSRINAILSILSMLLLVGCASPQKMAFHDDSISIESIQNPIFLMTATLKNVHKTSHQPKLLVVHIEKSEATDSSDRLNFVVDDKAKNESDDPDIGSKYLIRMELESGEYVIRGLTSMSSSFPIIGSFFAPIHEDLKALKTGVFYLGNVNAVVRKRNGNEFKAGSSVPLIDQAIAGASNGTFDIEISDKWDIDGPEFRETFPALAKINIEKLILPEFNRERAQKWWDEN